MQTLVERLYENKPLMYAAAVIAFLIAALLLLIIIRMLFGSRLRMPGSRARQARLGIVDAFDLDRQRQLIIVRRDNTEHLIMIGGPNDLVIESEIVRVEARDARRDKDGQGPLLPTLTPFNEPRIPAPAPPERAELLSGLDEPGRASARPVEEVPVLPMPLPTPIPAPARVDSPAASSPVSIELPPQDAVAPAPPRAPTFPLPPRRPAPPNPNRPVTRPLERVMRTEPVPPSLDEPAAPAPEMEQPAPIEPSAPPPAPARPAPPPFLRPLPPRVTKPLQRPVAPGAGALPSNPSASAPSVPPPAPVPPTPAQQPIASPAPEPAQTGPKDTLESLEEEMAKLLGRGAGER